MSDPIQILLLEHKLILKVVHALAVIDADLEQQRSVDPDMIRKIVEFMQVFADKITMPRKKIFFSLHWKQKAFLIWAAHLAAWRESMSGAAHWLGHSPTQRMTICREKQLQSQICAR